MKIKSGDNIKIIAGKDKGKTGKVLQVFPLKKLISVEGRNLLIKHMRPRRQNEKGQRIEFPAPFSISNVMLICSRCGKPTRIEYKIAALNTESQKQDPSLKNLRKIKKDKVRICKKCKQPID